MHLLAFVAAEAAEVLITWASRGAKAYAAARAKAWLEAAVDAVLRKLTGKTASEWEKGAAGLLGINISAVQTESGMALKDYIMKEVFNGIAGSRFLERFGLDLDEDSGQRALRLEYELYEKPIPKEISLEDWARDVGARFNLSPDVVLKKRLGT